jgi:trimeric autotransporter adhesin
MFRSNQRGYNVLYNKHLSNCKIEDEIEPIIDSKIDLGSNSKHFRKAYIDEIDTDLLYTTTVSTGNFYSVLSDLEEVFIEDLTCERATIANLITNNLTAGNIVSLNSNISNSTINNLLSSNISTANLRSVTISATQATIGSLKFDNVEYPLLWGTEGDGKLKVDNQFIGWDPIDVVSTVSFASEIGLPLATIASALEIDLDQLENLYVVRLRYNDDHLEESGSLLSNQKLQLKLPVDDRILFTDGGNIESSSTMRYNFTTNTVTLGNTKIPELDAGYIEGNQLYYDSATIGKLLCQSDTEMYGKLNVTGDVEMNKLELDDTYSTRITAGALKVDGEANFIGEVEFNKQIGDDSYFTRITASNLFVENRMTTSNLWVTNNATLGSLYIKNDLDAINATFSTLNLTGQSRIENSTMGDIKVTNSTFSNILVTNISTSNIISGFAKYSNLTVGNYLTFLSGEATNFSAGNVSFGNLRNSYATLGNVDILSIDKAQNGFFENQLSAGNLYANLISTGNLYGANSTFGNLRINNDLKIQGDASIGSLKVVNDVRVSDTTPSTSNSLTSKAYIEDCSFLKVGLGLMTTGSLTGTKIDLNLDVGGKLSKVIGGLGISETYLAELTAEKGKVVALETSVAALNTYAGVRAATPFPLIGIGLNQLDFYLFVGVSVSLAGALISITALTTDVTAIGNLVDRESNDVYSHPTGEGYREMNINQNKTIAFRDLTCSSGITTANLISTNASIGILSAPIVNFSNSNSTNLTIANLISTNASIGTLSVPVVNWSNSNSANLTVANLISTNANITNLSTTNITVPNLNVSTLTSGSANITNLTVASAMITNITTVSLITTNLSSTNVTIPNLSLSSLTSTNANITNLTTSNLSISSITAGSLLSTNGNIINMTTASLVSTTISSANIRGTNVTVSNVIATNLTSSNASIANYSGGSVQLSGSMKSTSLSLEDGSKFFAVFSTLGDGTTIDTGTLSDTQINYMQGGTTRISLTTSGNMNIVCPITATSITTGNINITSTLKLNGVANSTTNIQQTTVSSGILILTSNSVGNGGAWIEMYDNRLNSGAFVLGHGTSGLIIRDSSNSTYASFTKNVIQLSSGTGLRALNSSNTIGSLFTESGNVGIGTTSLISTLNVSGDATFSVNNTASSNSLTIASGNESQQSILYFGTPNLGISTSSAKKTAIIANGLTSWSRSDLHFCLNQNVSNNTVSTTIADTRMMIRNDGNVGVNTTNPVGLLHTKTRDATSSGDIGGWDNTYTIIGGATSNSGANAGSIGLGYNSTTGSIITSLAPSTAWKNITYLGSGHIMKVNNIEVMRITSGNVGIGTTAPAYKLDVNGNLGATSVTTTSLQSTNAILSNITTSNLIASNINIAGFKLQNNSNNFVIGSTNGTAYIVGNSSGTMNMYNLSGISSTSITTGNIVSTGYLTSLIPRAAMYSIARPTTTAGNRIVYDNPMCTARNITTNLLGGTITITVAGTYRCSFSGFAQNDSSTATEIKMRRDGLSFARAYTDKTASTYSGSLVIEAMFDLTVGEVLDVYVSQGAMHGTENNCFSVQMIG